MIDNHGVLEGIRPRDFVAGIIEYKVRNESGNWKPYLPPGEFQKGHIDTMACVTFSLLNCIETQERFLTGKTVNYSDRWIAMMSGTTHDGNNLGVVADTVRKYGLVKEESWPTPPNFTWDTYYAVPDATKMAELKAEGQKWLETHFLEYEYVGNTLDALLYHLKQSPLQVVKPGHAIEGFYEEGDVMNYFDSYQPFEKTLKYDRISYVLKPVLTITNMAQFKTQNKGGELRLVLQAATIPEWIALCKVYGVDPSVVDEFVN